MPNFKYPNFQLIEGGVKELQFTGVYSPITMTNRCNMCQVNIINISTSFTDNGFCTSN